MKTKLRWHNTLPSEWVMEQNKGNSMMKTLLETMDQQEIIKLFKIPMLESCYFDDIDCDGLPYDTVSMGDSFRKLKIRREWIVSKCKLINTAIESFKELCDNWDGELDNGYPFDKSLDELVLEMYSWIEEQEELK